MSFLHLAKKRYSERKYLAKEIEPEKVAQILEAGRVAPTAANMQPHHLIVVQSQKGHDQLKKAANVYNAPLAIIVCADHDRSWKRPLDGKTTTDIDASIVTDHLMLEATDLSLASVWICYFKADVLKAEFNLPDNLEPINILAVGYAGGDGASPDRHDQTRKPLNEIVTYV